MKEIELTIEEGTDDGVFAVSLVGNPAMEGNFIALSKNNIELKVIDEERRVVVGLALEPEKRITRVKDGKEFKVWFSSETIAKTQEVYMRNLNANNVNEEHKKPIKGATVIESWIVESEKHDKSNLFNLSAKVGSWILMMKIENDEEWASIKDGIYLGYSIEGHYSGFEQLQSKEVSADEKLLNELRELLTNAELKGILTDKPIKK